MIVNYLASGKTRAPFCGLYCCGNAFVVRKRSNEAVSPKRKMRRYAKHADKLNVKKEIEMELTGDYNDWEVVDEDDYYAEVDRLEAQDVIDTAIEHERQEEALEQEADIIEGEMRDEYFREIELED